MGSDAITTGLIYRPATVTAEGKAEVRVIGNPQKNRPALLQTFVLDAKSKSRVTVAVNHLKSKGSSCADQVVDGQSDVDKGDGQGNCNLTRVQAVRDLMAWYATRPQPGPNDGMLLLGDMNSYAKEDPIRAFESAGFNNLLARWSRDAYSYVFNGESGNLDHALADKALSSMVLAAGEWHINADEPTALEYSSEFKSAEQQQKYYAADAYRSSDHDPLYVDVARRGNAVAAADEVGCSCCWALARWQRWRRGAASAETGEHRRLAMAARRRHAAAGRALGRGGAVMALRAVERRGVVAVAEWGLGARRRAPRLPQ